MKLIDLVIVFICLFSALLIIYKNYIKKKTQNAHSCGGSCAGCSGCVKMKKDLWGEENS